MIPDIPAEAICVCCKGNTQPGDGGTSDFYKYMPHLCDGRWGSSFIYVCFRLSVPLRGLFSLVPTGLLLAEGGGGGGGRMERVGFPMIQSGEVAWSRAKKRLCHLLLANLPPSHTPLPSLTLFTSKMGTIPAGVSWGCCEAQMKCLFTCWDCQGLFYMTATCGIFKRMQMCEAPLRSGTSESLGREPR